MLLLTDMGRSRLALVGVIQLLACAGGDAGRTPPAPSGSSAGGKADTYGQDDRRELFDPANDPRAVEWARSTVVFVRKTRVNDERISSPTLARRIGVCESEPFALQPSAGSCTGFLVAEDLVVTAGHCLTGVGSLCDGHYAVFDFAYLVPDDDPTWAPDETVYGCADVLDAGFDEDEDWALLRLDRPVLDRAPLPLRRERPDSLEGPLVLIGSPAGVPLKIDAGGEVVETATHVFTTTFDSYSGQSGGVVMGLGSGLVEGLHFSGAPDYVESPAGCLLSQACGEVSAGSETCWGSKELFADVFGHAVPE